MIRLKLLNTNIHNKSQVLESEIKNKNDKENFFFFFLYRIIPNIITKNMIWNQGCQNWDPT